MAAVIMILLAAQAQGVVECYQDGAEFYIIGSREVVVYPQGVTGMDMAQAQAARSWFEAQCQAAGVRPLWS